jgi:hypothetical protein
MCGKQVPGIIANSSGMSSLVLRCDPPAALFFCQIYSRIIHKDSHILNKILEAITLREWDAVLNENLCIFKARYRVDRPVLFRAPDPNWKPTIHSLF